MKAFLLLLLICGVASGSEWTLYRRNPAPHDHVRVQYQYTVPATMPNGTYQVQWTWTRSGVQQTPFNDTITVANGVVSGADGYHYSGNDFTAGTVIVDTAAKVYQGGTLLGNAYGTYTVNFAATAAGSAVEYGVVNLPVSLLVEPCPPRNITFGINGNFKNGQPLVVRLEVDEQVKASLTVPGTTNPNGTNVTIVEGPIATTGSFTYAWVTADGYILAAGVVGCSAEVINDEINDVVSYTEDFNPEEPPVEEVDIPGGPTAPPTPGPDTWDGTTPGTVPPGTPAPTPGPPGPPGQGGTSGGGGNGGDVNVMNTNDFYAPFKKALDDWGREGALAPIVGPIEMPAYGDASGEIPEENEGWDKADELGGVLGDLQAKWASLVDLRNFFPTTGLNLPQGFGTKLVYDITLQLPGGPRSYTMSLTAYQDAIAMARDFAKMVLVIGFWFLTVRTLRGMSA